MAAPQSCTAGWVLNSQEGIEGLTFVEQLALPPVNEDEILVKIHAASLNYRDIMIAKVKEVSLLPLLLFSLSLYLL
jgi:NADPH:quinone reductase-like Zn-dependent oxidoreductase